jgi:hypothetical protein
MILGVKKVKKLLQYRRWEGIKIRYQIIEVFSGERER